jgi:hypothetical protein
MRERYATKPGQAQRLTNKLFYGTRFAFIGGVRSTGEALQPEVSYSLLSLHRSGLAIRAISMFLPKQHDARIYFLSDKPDQFDCDANPFVREIGKSAFENTIIPVGVAGLEIRPRGPVNIHFGNEIKLPGMDVGHSAVAGFLIDAVANVQNIAHLTRNQLLAANEASRQPRSSVVNHEVIQLPTQPLAPSEIASGLE